MDIIFRNGNGVRFRFAFQFEFEFLPGFLGDDGMCSYRDIEKSNPHFAYSTSNTYAISVWNQLTKSLYDFELGYDGYRHSLK